MERNSRFNREPILTDGKPDAVAIVKSDIELFKVMARYPYLNVEWLAALTGGSPKALNARLNRLKRKPNCFVKVADAQVESPRRYLYEKLSYELDKPGRRIIEELGVSLPEKTTKILAHQTMVSEVMASFELGAKGDIRLIPWSEILDREETPAKLLRDTHPFTFPVSYGYRREHHKKNVTPDGRPFGLEWDDGDNLHEYFFIGFEADCATEPVESSQWGRSSIERKFCEYMAIADQQLYRSHFGFPNLYVPFIFTEAARMRTAMALLERMDAPMREKRIFLFQVHSKKPNGNMVKQPWQRIDGKSLQFGA